MAFQFFQRLRQYVMCGAVSWTCADSKDFHENSLVEIIKIFWQYVKKENRIGKSFPIF